MILLIDNFDSFTFNLYDYILQTNESCIVKRNDAIDIQEIKDLNPSGIVLSPGPGRPKDHPLLFKILDAFKEKIPIFGVCLGFQAIGEYFGMELVNAKEPKHGKVSVITHPGTGIFMHLNSPMNITRYHSLILTKYLNSDFKIISLTEDCVPMAGKHNNFPIYGVQFHPEAILTEHGLRLINNWVQLIKS